MSASLKRFIRSPFARWRLATRLVAMSIVLLLAVQAIGQAALHAAVQRNVSAELSQRLVVGERIWLRLLEQRAAKLAQGASVLAADYGFRSALASDDQATIASALENQGARLGAAASALLDTQLVMRAFAGVDDAAALAVREALALQVKTSGERGALVLRVGDHAYQFVVTPVRAPVVIGWVAMGFEIDRALIDDLHALSGIHGTLQLDDAQGQARTLATSLAPQDAASVERIDGTHSASLHRDVVMSAGTGARIVMRLSGSLDAAAQPYAALQWSMVLLSIAGVAMFAACSAWVARHITQPLNRLVRASARLGRGEYDAPIDRAQGGVEVSELATAFDAMRRNIGQQQHQIRDLAFRDRLTGLPNRASFVEAVNARIAEAGLDPIVHEGRDNHDPHGQGSGHAEPPSPFCVAVFDLARFRHVNDVLGFANGDRLLQGVAARLQVLVREGDLVARLGADDFALLLPRADTAAAHDVAQRVLAAFEAPLTLDDQAVDLGCAIGVACWPLHSRHHGSHHGTHAGSTHPSTHDSTHDAARDWAPDAASDAGRSTEADTLLQRAEIAMYAAKKRNAGVQVYDASLDGSSAENLSLMSQLRRAIEHDELRLYLQPKIDVAARALTGAEALVRWQHPQRGLVPPAKFIPFAEQSGFIRAITLWMVNEVVRHKTHLASMGVHRISINLSTQDLLDVELPDKLDAILRRHGQEAAGLCLEITESAIMDDPDRAQQTLERLSQRGFKLSIDDFGTGYSSLAYLKRLPVNEIKIDRSFVMNMAADTSDAKIVRSTVDLAHGLGLTVVAEGVETEPILDTLAALRCDEAQGYHIAKPLELAAFERWVLAQRERECA